MKKPDHRFCVAPMMDWTDRHCRVFHRLLTRNARLYTEMVTTDAVLRGDFRRLLAYSTTEHPLALQLGGSAPKDLTACAKIGEDLGYNEINLNVGCPSDRVQNRKIGACLMAVPELVAECLHQMQSAVSIPISVKCRLGIDDQDTEQDFQNFIDIVAQSGIKIFIIHARKAILSGVSPKANREIPPLDYHRVYRLKSSRSDLTIILNGGISTLEECEKHLGFVDGVMMGRAAYKFPYLLSEVDGRIFHCIRPQLSRREVLEELIPYIEHHLKNRGRVNNILKHTLGLYHSCPGGRQYRRIISEEAHSSSAGLEVLLKALSAVEKPSSSRNFYSPHNILDALVNQDAPVNQDALLS